MGSVLENSLFKKDYRQFLRIKEMAVQFNSSYNGRNIIQDDIFSILTNYAKRNQVALHVFRLAVDDEEFCAFTCVKKGRIFLYVNANLPLAKQIFAAAHELYHIWCFISEYDESVLRKGSFLNAGVIDEEMKSQEDRDANAFAGLLLVSSDSLFEQMNIYGISREHQSLEDIIRLMAIFAVPYKAMVLRLYEEGYMSEKKARAYLEMEQMEVEKKLVLEEDAWRWQRRTPELAIVGGLDKLIEYNFSYEFLTDSREASDRKILNEIMKKYRGGGET